MRVDVGAPGTTGSVSFMRLPSAVQDLVKVGDLLYVALDSDRVAIVDVTDPGIPRLVSTFAVGYAVMRLQVKGDTLLVGLVDGAVLTYLLRTPRRPVFMAVYEADAPNCPKVTQTTKPRARPPRDLQVSLSLGFSYRRALNESFLGGAADMEISKDLAEAAFGWRFGIHAGKTLAGLTYEWLYVGVGYFWRRGARWYLGLAPILGVLIIQRSTVTRSFATPTLGATLDARVNLLLNHDRSSPYLHLRLGGDFVGGSPYFAAIATAGVGYGF